MLEEMLDAIDEDKREVFVLVELEHAIDERAMQTHRLEQRLLGFDLARQRVDTQVYLAELASAGDEVAGFSTTSKPLSAITTASRSSTWRATTISAWRTTPSSSKPR